MPVGVNVEDDPINPGFVLVEFVNTALRGPALHTLIAAGGPDVVETLTREKGSERTRYRMPSGNATAAGLIDGSGVVLDDITQTGPEDASGIVLPDPGTTHENIHAPVIRRGSYKNGYGDNVQETQPSQPVNPDIAEPTQAEVAEYVTTNERTLKQREGREPWDGGDEGGSGLMSPFAAQAEPLDTGSEIPADEGDSAEDLNVDGPAGYPTDSVPSMDWRRNELNAYALAIKGIDTSSTTEYPAKADVLNAINTPV